MTLVISIFFTACGEPAANTANKASNAVNATNSANANAVPANPAAAEAEIKKLMDSAQAALAKNDAEAMDKVYSENYMLVNIDGSLQSRADRLAALQSGETKYESFAYSEPNIRVNPEGTGAVVIAKLNMKGTTKGKVFDGTYRVSQVYAKTKDGWKQVSAQATKIEGDSTPSKMGAQKPEEKKTGDKPAVAANK